MRIKFAIRSISPNIRTLVGLHWHSYSIIRLSGHKFLRLLFQNEGNILFSRTEACMHSVVLLVYLHDSQTQSVIVACSLGLIITHALCILTHAARNILKLLWYNIIPKVS